VIADTGFLIDVMAKEPEAVKKAQELEEGGTSILVGSPTVFELFAGVSLTRRPEEEKSRIMTVLSSLPQLALDFPSASAGGLIYGERERVGRRIDRRTLCSRVLQGSRLRRF